ncbi:MAG: tetratricopeptide repeat protein [Methylococcales bacterium]|nr:tetratricopeptide repeat protein [Methylococcales bacterium]
MTVLAPDNPLLQQASALYQAGKLPEAAAAYRELLKSLPENAELLAALGAILLKTGQFAESAGYFDRSLATEPAQPQALLYRGIALMRLERFDAALASYEQAIAVKADFADAWCNRGNALIRLRRMEEALRSFDTAIALKADFVLAHFNRGNVLREMKRLPAALDSYRRAIALKADFAEAWRNLGCVCREMNRMEDALLAYEQTIRLRPGQADSHVSLGNILKDLERFAEALARYDAALALTPQHTEALSNRGIVLQELKRFTEALDSYERAIAIDPGYADAYCNRGISLHSLKRFAEALASFDRALSIKPDYAQVYNNRGNTLRLLNRFDEAAACYDKAIAIDANFAEAYCNRSLALYELKRVDEALLSCERALALKPGFADAWHSRAIIMENFGRYREALQSYEQALAIKPGLDFAHGQYLFARLMLCIWENTDRDAAGLAADIGHGLKAANPFNVLAITDDPALQRRAAEIWSREDRPTNHALPAIARYPQHDRIRIGYFSADFRNHPVAFQSLQLFGMHDRNRFEIFGFSFTADRDEMTERLATGFEHFIDIRNLSDREAVELARSLEIDIAVDLGGHTSGSRNNLFALRAAPVQAAYLGYCGSLGADYMDYLFADPIVVPQAGREFYTENIACLPDCFMVNDNSRPISDRVFRREDFGLPATGFVFCCFNNTWKLNPALFDRWMRILADAPGSVLWLSVEDPAIADNLAREARNRGLANGRLIFAKRLPVMAEHLARLRLADLFLDTLPYNAHATACDALWAGLPVLTCMGESFAGRVAASLLNAIGLPELATGSAAEYQALAIELATHPDKLAAIKARLAANRLTAPLFDTPRLTRQIESVFERMYARNQAGLPPAHLEP